MLAQINRRIVKLWLQTPLLSKQKIQRFLHVQNYIILNFMTRKTYKSNFDASSQLCEYNYNNEFLSLFKLQSANLLPKLRLILNITRFTSKQSQNWGGFVHDVLPHSQTAPPLIKETKNRILSSNPAAGKVKFCSAHHLCRPSSVSAVKSNEV